MSLRQQKTVRIPQNPRIINGMGTIWDPWAGTSYFEKTNVLYC